MTKTISLLRHAKSGWDDPVAKDFDRPLNRKGEKAARLMGEWLKNQSISFGHVIASPAVRVIETLDHLATGYGKRFEPVWDRRVYLASGATLMDVLRDADSGIDHILMVGHNPGMEDLALELVPDTSNDGLRDQLYAKFPTASFAQIEIPINSWADIESKIGKLRTFVRPRDLDPALGPDGE